MKSLPTATSRAMIGALLVALALQASASGAISSADTADRVDAAVDAAVGYLWRDHDGDHWPEDLPGAAAQDHGGRTALCVYALLATGQNRQDERMVRTLDWLTQVEMKSVYARSFRVLALAQASPNEPIREVIASDLRWLLESAGPDGAYDYLGPGVDQAWDNSNTHMANLAVWTAAEAGYAVPIEYWRRAQVHWITAQTGDGGWSYVSARKRAYGSMSAAGLASLFMCYDELNRDARNRPGSQAAAEPIRRGLGWLEENFSAWENPGRGPQYYHYYLWAVESVGRTSGYAYFGEHDWFAAGTAELLRTQRPDGGWGDFVDTCFSLAYLGLGRHPILFSKLKYDGAWNARPRDMANLSRWVGARFERPVRWQIVGVDSPVERWRNAPILYISGAGVPKFTPKQIDALRRYAEGGGLILSEAAANSPAFNVAMRKAYARIFPDRALEAIDPSHPVYSTHRELRSPMRLEGVSNGVRLLAIHSSGDLSKAWQLRDTVRRADAFQLAANVYFHATDFGVFGRRNLPFAAETEAAGEPGRVIRIARLTHDGNANPEPTAYQRLAAVMASRYRTHLEFSKPMDPSGLQANTYPVALMTGTETLTLSDADRAGLRSFVNAGGLLVVDAAGGSDAFDASVREQVLTLVDDVYPKVGRLSPESPIYKRPGMTIENVTFRRAARALYGDDRSPRLQVVSVNGRPVIVYSRDDITAGLVGYHGHNLRGYVPADAVALMRNLLLYAADRPAATDVLKGSVNVEWNPSQP